MLWSVPIFFLHGLSKVSARNNSIVNMPTRWPASFSSSRQAGSTETVVVALFLHVSVPAAHVRSCWESYDCNVPQPLQALGKSTSMDKVLRRPKSLMVLRKVRQLFSVPRNNFVAFASKVGLRCNACLFAINAPAFAHWGKLLNRPLIFQW